MNSTEKLGVKKEWCSNQFHAHGRISSDIYDLRAALISRAISHVFSAAPTSISPTFSGSLQHAAPA
jgi:hypothetical protein